MGVPMIVASMALGLQLDASPVSQDFAPTVVATERFELRSDPHVALHHLLIDWATADADEWPPYALPIVERERWESELDERERGAWSAAVAAYGATVGRSLLFDEGLLAARDWASGVATRADVPAPDRPLIEAIEAALPVYARHWWPAHDARSRTWIDSVAPTLAAVEEEMIGRLEAAYGGRWPQGRIPVDVVVYANAVGAYSTGGRVTVSSAHRGNQMPQALEMIFHESSHIDPLERALRAGITGAFRAAGGEAPERFWHDVIFYTAGEVTRLVLAERGQPGYRHYGELGVYRRGERWSVELPALESHWRPFLESGSDDAMSRDAALRALAGSLLEEP